MASFVESSSPHRTLQLVALMEAVKGFIVFGAGFGLLTLLHRDLRHVAESLVTRLHIHPDNHFAGIFLNAAAHLTDARLWGLAALAVAYSVLRWTEAWGPWFVVAYLIRTLRQGRSAHTPR
ncbi:MAG: DUF2127 domain-containing protein [Pseudomonadota bacterium]